MKLNTKLNAIILGFTMILSMQTAFAACKQSFATQQKKVATISKKKVAGGKKIIYRKASMRKYSQKKLNQIMRTLERKFLSADNSSAWRNVVGFGIGDNSIDVALRWNTKEKQQEFRNQIYNSSVIKFGDKLDPVIDNKTGVSSYNGISIKAESPSYPLGSTEIKITITNHSGKEFMYGEAYSITAQGADGNWEWTHEANKQNANKLKSIFISNNSFYLLQLKGCHERHLLTIYAILIKKAVNAWFVGKNIGKKMGSNGAALTIV